MKTIKTIIKKAVFYGRVSSDRQEREGFSIPAQTKLAQQYAKENNINIVAEFIEAETAKKAGRAEFNKMIAYLKKHKNVNIILVEKTDRLYRNLKDYVIIDELGEVEIHFFKEGNILSSNSKSQDKFMHGIRVLMAKNYIDNLSEEIRKGLKEKAEQGFYPSKAPVGYKNKVLESGRRIIVTDPATAPFVKQAFELYGTGRYTYTSTAKKLSEDGFRINGHKCTAKNIERILNNPFYFGVFEYRGKFYSDARHEPLITKEQFLIVQRLLSAKYPTKPQKREFAYNGLIRCSNCGCQLVGELKKGKYIYYHCTNSKKLDVSKPSMRQERIEELFADFLKKLSMPVEEFERLKETVKEFINQGCEYIEQKNTENKRRIDVLNRRLNKLYDDKIDGIITDDFYYEKRDEWQKELDELCFAFEQTATSSRTLIDSAEIIIELSKDAHSLFLRQSPKEKAELMKLLTIELLFDGQNLIITPHSAFANLIKLLNCHKLELTSLSSNLLLQNFVDSLSDVIFLSQIKKYKNCA
ncbi:MAG: recombinase family protein [Clostridia bacterium]|nr:recombinase family protein [Clostridia bacterium]